MNILVGCERSGEVRRALRSKGHNAISVDLEPSDDHSIHHFQTDVCDARRDSRWRWNIIIMHPPCTALAVSGNRWYGTGMPKHDERIAAIQWTMALWELAKQHAPRVCMENPVGVLPVKPTQYVQPWQFGHGETKKTGLWLHGLRKLKPSNIVAGREQLVWKMAPSPDRAERRSKTYTGIAQAMADQWA